MADKKKRKQGKQGGEQAKVVSLAKMRSHPLRVRILNEIGDGVMSPNGLANALGEPLGNVSYHVKTLVEGNALVLVKTEPRRGAVEHFYKVVGSSPADDTLALDEIAKLIYGRHPNEISWSTVAELVRATGRKVAEPPEQQAKAA